MQQKLARIQVQHTDACLTLKFEESSQSHGLFSHKDEQMIFCLWRQKTFKGWWKTLHLKPFQQKAFFSLSEGNKGHFKFILKGKLNYKQNLIFLILKGQFCSDGSQWSLKYGWVSLQECFTSVFWVRVPTCTPPLQISAEGGTKLSLLDVGQQSWCGKSTG